ILDVPVEFTAAQGDFANGAFNITLSDLTEQGSVVLEESTNMMKWIPIYTNPPAFGQIHFTDTTTNSLIRYYKAVVLPP
ncbi:MAG: hypothetical protein ABSA47_18325, partial [Verrucomicrobiota bacterium]